MAITGDQRLLKRINRMALVRLVRSQPGLSRAELAVATGLTKSTVSLLAQELIDEAWLREDKVLVTGAIGRRPTPLRLDGRRLVLIGAELGVGSMTVLSVSLDGEVIQRAFVRTASEDSPAQLCEQMASMIAAQVRTQVEAGRELLGIGLGVAGAVLESSGVLVLGPNLGWRNLPLRDMLEAALLQRLGYALPLFVQNDADVAALGEVEFAASAIGDPLLYLSLGVGVGSGVVVGGRLLLGQRGFAGEVGHMQLAADGPRCSCGRTGCVEAFIGLRAMANAAGCSAEELESRVRAGDAASLAVVAAAGRRLGVLIHNLWATLDPALIVLGGESCRLGEALLGPARETYRDLALVAGLEPVAVQASRFGDLAVAAGAAALVLHKLLLPI